MRLYVLFLSCLLLLTTGCGFHLRGHLTIDPKFHTLSITPHNPYEPFQKTLRQLLKNYEIQMDKTKNSPSLVLQKQEFSEQVLAYDFHGQPFRILIKFTLHYQVLDKAGKVLHSTSQIEVGREMNANVQERLSTEYERARIEEELYRDAANQLLYQLATLFSL